MNNPCVQDIGLTQHRSVDKIVEAKCKLLAEPFHHTYFTYGYF